MLSKKRIAELRNICPRSDSQVLFQAVRELLDAYRKLQARNTELEQRFDRIWAANKRGIEKWQAAGEGRELKRPGRADMVAFLLEENFRLKADLGTALCDEYNSLVKELDKPKGGEA